MIITTDEITSIIIDGKEYDEDDIEEIVREREKYEDMFNLSLEICKKYSQCSECPLFTSELNGFCV